MLNWDIDPVAFRIFGLPVAWYGILICVGILLATFVATREAKRKGMNPDRIYDVLFYAIPMAIIGARLYYVIFEWQYYSQHPFEILAIRNGGLAIHGGLIAAILTGYFYCKKKGISFFEMLDTTVVAIPLGQAIGRWGNFINKEAHGTVTDLPWGILIDGQKVHPTFLYESIGDLIIFFVLLYFARHKQKHVGTVLPLYMILYGVLRFFVEGLRTDSLYFLGLRMAQLISIAFVIFGIIWFIRASRQPENIK